ncbi:MAG: hypothetical protein RLZZ182_633 [Pseudomonadota bacterium]|jgi:glycosyltransferase involved in cell wall biosynthesis
MSRTIAATRSTPYDLAIIGTVGLPAGYGGFETLAEQLVMHLGGHRQVLVVCSGKRQHSPAERPAHFGQADLHYIELDANGWQSIPYDIQSLWHCAPLASSLLVLGVSGCAVLPVIRRRWPQTRIVTNIDGLEWKRQKWGRLARAVLKASEAAAVRYSHAVVSDNEGIQTHVRERYGQESSLIAYGGDHVLLDERFDAGQTRFNAGTYDLAICRIEPENNIHIILEAFSACPTSPLILIGNWQHSDYARALKARFGSYSNLELKDPIYDQRRLSALRSGARALIHGHSAGGTNPSLVEAMNAALPVLAFDVNYNRFTTEGQAQYWRDSAELQSILMSSTSERLRANARCMTEIAQRRYRWHSVAAAYDQILFPDSFTL